MYKKYSEEQLDGMAQTNRIERTKARKYLAAMAAIIIVTEVGLKYGASKWILLPAVFGMAAAGSQAFVYAERLRARDNVLNRHGPRP